MLECLAHKLRQNCFAALGCSTFAFLAGATVMAGCSTPTAVDAVPTPPEGEDPGPERSESSKTVKDAEPSTSPDAIDLATDPSNCGKKGHSCLGGTCSKGACDAVDTKIDVTVTEGPYADGKQVYVVGSTIDFEFRGLVRVPVSGASVRIESTLEGGSDPSILGTDLGYVDGGFLFANYRFKASGPHQGILKVDLASGAITKVRDTTAASTTSFWNVPFGHDATHLYWVDGEGMHRQPRAGGTAELFAASVLKTLGGTVQRMAADAKYLYLGIGTSVIRLDTKTLEPKKLMDLTYDVAAIALDDTNVFAMSNAGFDCTDTKQPFYPAGITVAPKNGSSTAKVIVEDVRVSSIAAATKGAVIWHDECAGEVHRWSSGKDVVIGKTQKNREVQVAYASGAVFWAFDRKLWKRAE